MESSENIKENNFSLEEIKSIVLSLWNSRGTVLKITGIITVISLIIVFILPKQFRSTVILLPDTDKTKLAGMAGFSNLAALAGVNLGTVTIEQLYPTIISSETIMKKVIYAKYYSEDFKQKINLIEYWDISEDTEARNFEIAMEKLKDRLDVNFDKITNVVTVSLWMPEAQLSADILDTLASSVDSFIRYNRNTNAAEQRRWIESRLDQVKNDLSKAENALKNFREQNRIFDNSPQLQLQQARLMREVEMQSTIYGELRKQYELAKIEEIKTVPVINVLDYPRAAGKKDKPKRALITIVTFFFSFTGSCFYVIIREKFETEIRDFFSIFKRKTRL